MTACDEVIGFSASRKNPIDWHSDNENLTQLGKQVAGRLISMLTFEGNRNSLHLYPFVNFNPFKDAIHGVGRPWPYHYLFPFLKK